MKAPDIQNGLLFPAGSGSRDFIELCRVSDELSPSDDVMRITTLATAEELCWDLYDGTINLDGSGLAVDQYEDWFCATAVKRALIWADELGLATNAKTPITEVING